MPLYYFSLESGRASMPAADAEDLPDDEAARLHAEGVANELAQGKPANMQAYVLVRNDRGEKIHSAYLLGRAPNSNL
jgi:hypothetical protein